MIVTIFFECPRCKYKSETKYDIGEHFCDLERCNKCKHKLTPQDLNHLDRDANSVVADYAEYFLS